MRRSARILLGSLAALALVAACQTDTESLPDGFEFPEVPEPDRFPTIPCDPYEMEEERLGVGIFYGGDRSETIALDGDDREYFIFEQSYEQTTVDDRIEGRRSDEITLNGTPFWGGGVIWMTPVDISKWTTLNVAFKSSDPSFEAFELTVQSGDGEPADGVAVDVRDYGFVNDGEWHCLEVPLQDFVDAGWDPTLARSPFIVGSPGGTEGDVLLIDDLYFTRDLDELDLGTGGTGGAGE